MTANELAKELQDAQDSLRPCDCGARLLIRYQPGLTIIGCIKCGQLDKEADWAPREIAKRWQLPSKDGLPSKPHGEDSQRKKDPHAHA